MKINIKKLTETAILPERGSAYAAGYDLFADVKEVLEIAPHTTAMIPTGLAMEIPKAVRVLYMQDPVLPAKRVWHLRIKSALSTVITAGL